MESTWATVIKPDNIRTENQQSTPNPITITGYLIAIAYQLIEYK